MRISDWSSDVCSSDLAADVNQTQLYLVALKKAAIEYLDYEDVLVFLGFREGTDRLVMFRRIKATLGTDVRQYWERHTEAIAKGIIPPGKFARYIHLFAHKEIGRASCRERVCPHM